jgi:predicted nucleic acid-binding protein
VTYFDAAYVAKCYLNEPRAELVRAVAARATEGLVSSELARVEFASILARHVREGHLTPIQAARKHRQFAQDERAGVWAWVRVTPTLVEHARAVIGRLPASVPVRTLDALHLVSALAAGVREVYTNDRHLLRAASYCDLEGIDVLDGQP